MRIRSLRRFFYNFFTRPKKKVDQIVWLWEKFFYGFWASLLFLRDNGFALVLLAVGGIVLIVSLVIALKGGKVVK